jgi:iron complex outermembrane receptor protein
MGAPATASLRGATAAQTPVYLGGVRINDEVGGAANLSDVPLFLVDRVEVYRSNAPPEVELGVGGALLFEPKRLRRSELGLGVVGGSYGTRGANAYASYGNGSRWLLAGTSVSAAENDYEFFDKNGQLLDGTEGRPARLPNADATLKSFWLLGGSDTADGKLELLFHHSDREQGATKLAQRPSESARASYTRDAVALTSSLPIDAFRGELRLSTAATTATTVLDDPQDELGLARKYVETPGERLEQNVSATQTHESGLRVSEQLGVSTDRLRRFERQGGALVEAVSARRFTLRPSLGAELPVGGGFSVSALGALRCYDTSTSGLEACSTLLPEGRVGAAFEASGLELYGNVGRYNRPPTLGELYGATQLVRGNDTLVAEKGQSAELGLRLQSASGPRLWLDAAAFARRTSALITYVPTAQGYLHPVNRDSARTLGGELSVGAEPLTGLESSVNASVLDARDTSPDRETVNDVLPFSSRFTLSGLVGYTARFEGTVDEVGANVRCIHQSSRYADPAGLAVIPAQTSVDLEVVARFLARNLTTRARMANLFDERRFDVVGFPLPGRSAFFSLEAKW